MVAWVSVAAVGVGRKSVEFEGGIQRLWVWEMAFSGGVTENCLAFGQRRKNGCHG